MKQNLFNKLWLRVGMIVAIMTTALSGTAWAEDQTITLDYNSFGLTTSYAVKTATVNGFSFTVNQGYKGSGNTIQMNSSKGSGILYNTTAIPGLKSIKVNVASGNKTYTITTGTSEKPTTNSQTGTTGGTYNATSGDTFFQLKVSGASYFSSIEITYDPSSAVSVPSLSVSPDAIDFGEQKINDSYEETFDVTFANLTEDLTVSGFAGVTVSPTTISKTATSPQTVTVTYAPTAEGSISGNITVSNTADEVSQTVAVTGSAYDPSNLTYYEKITSAPSSWEGDYIFTGINSEEYYALTGVNSNLGTAAAVTVTEDGIAATPVTNAYKVTIAQTTNGYSLYMDGVGYLCYSGTKNELHASDELDNTGEWTISFADGVATITNVGVAGRMLQFNYNNGNPRFACYTSSQVKITLFKMNDGTPSLSADDVSIACDDEEGEIEYTISNPVSGGSIVASSTSDWLEVDGTAQTTSTGTFEFICDTNPIGTQRTAEVTLTYTFNTGTLTKTVIVTQAGNPDALVTIAEARAQTGTVKTKGIVTSCVGTTAFIQDATAAICVYGSELTVGDEVRVVGTITTSKGLVEITDPAVTVLSQNNTVTPEVMTIAQINASTNQGWFVKIENATVTEIGSNNNYTIAQGENTITLHGALGTEVSVNDIITFNGNIGCFNSVQIVNPTDVTVTGGVTPTSNIVNIGTLTNVTSVEMWYFDTDIVYIVNGAEVEANTEVFVQPIVEDGYEVESVTVVDANNNSVTVSENNGAWSFYMPNSSVTINATATASSVTPKTLTNANIVAAGAGASGYQSWTITDSNGKTWNAYAIKNQHSNATSDYHFLQIKKSDSSTQYYLQVPEYGTKITSITMTVSSTQKPMTDGGNTATLFFSAANSTSATGEGVVSGTGASTVTIDCSSLNLNTGYITASAGVRIWDVNVEYEEEAPRTLNGQGYATFASTSAVNFDDTGITAWAVTAVSGTSITFTQVEGVVAAGTGLLLKGAAGATINPEYSTNAGSAVTGNLLVGIVEDTPVNAYEYYGLSGQNFVKVKAGTVKAGRALLRASDVNATSGDGEAKVFTFVFEDDATGIKTIETVSAEEAAQIFNLAGQRISKMQKGINIVNGKKILK